MLHCRPYFDVDGQAWHVRRTMQAGDNCVHDVHDGAPMMETPDWIHLRPPGRIEYQQAWGGGARPRWDRWRHHTWEQDPLSYIRSDQRASGEPATWNHAA